MWKQVCVLGMHRSGTSALGNVVASMGFYVNETIVASEYNERGYAEDGAIVGVNDRALEECGGTWNWPVPVHRSVDRALRVVGPEIGRILDVYGAHEPWIIKDPRMCLTWPCWRPALNAPAILLCVRNPLAVAQSLLRRDNIALARGLKLWHIYTASAIANTAGLPRMVMHYETLTGPGKGEALERIRAFLGASPTDRRDGVDSDLAHHSLPASDLFSDPSVPPEVRRLYRLTLDAEEDISGLDSEEVQTAAFQSPALVKLSCFLNRSVRRNAWLSEVSGKLVTSLKARGLYPRNGMKGSRW